MIHPLFGKNTSIYIYAFIWILFAGIHFTIIFLVRQQSFSFAIAESLVFNVLYALIGLSIWYVVRYSDFESLSVTAVITNHVGAAAFLNAIWLYLSYFILKIIFPNQSNYIEFLQITMPWRGIVGIFIYVIISLVFYISIYYKNLQQRILHEQELKMNIKEAELNFLRSQINPHFLFNSLNSISSLTMVDAEKARNMIIRLSSFLRYSLGKDQKQVVSLKEEIENCKAYLEIEKIRFGERLEFKILIDKELEEKHIPNLLLQPLLENAIKHGVYESTEIVEIVVEIIRWKESIKIVIGNKFDPTAIPRKGKGIGIKNVKERLRLIYDNDQLIKISKEEDYFEVTLFIPQN